MRAIEKRLRMRLKNAESRVQELQNELNEVRQDRQRFREHFIRRFKWWIELIGSQQTPSLPWLIEDDAKELRKFQYFTW